MIFEVIKLDKNYGIKVAKEEFLKAQNDKEEFNMLSVILRGLCALDCFDYELKKEEYYQIVWRLSQEPAAKSVIFYAYTTGDFLSDYQLTTVWMFDK